MTKTRKFVVSIKAGEDDAAWALTAHNVYRALTDAVGYSRTIIWVEAVEPHYPPAKVCTSKIQAIKEIRFLTNLPLADSKSMADAAAALGKFKMHGINIEHDGATNAFIVTDQR